MLLIILLQNKHYGLCKRSCNKSRKPDPEQLWDCFIHPTYVLSQMPNILYEIFIDIFIFILGLADKMISVLLVLIGFLPVNYFVLIIHISDHVSEG